MTKSEEWDESEWKFVHEKESSKRYRIKFDQNDYFKAKHLLEEDASIAKSSYAWESPGEVTTGILSNAIDLRHVLEKNVIPAESFDYRMSH